MSFTIARRHGEERDFVEISCLEGTERDHTKSISMRPCSDSARQCLSGRKLTIRVRLCRERHAVVLALYQRLERTSIWRMRVQNDVSALDGVLSAMRPAAEDPDLHAWRVR